MAWHRLMPIPDASITRQKGRQRQVICTLQPGNNSPHGPCDHHKQYYSLSKTQCQNGNHPLHASRWTRPSENLKAAGWKVNKPAMALSRLDLPHPEGPTMSREWPGCRDMLKLRHSCRDLVGVNMLSDRSVRLACRRWVRTIRDKGDFVSVKAANTPPKLASQRSRRQGLTQNLLDRALLYADMTKPLVTKCMLVRCLDMTCDIHRLSTVGACQGISAQDMLAGFGLQE